MRRPTSILKLLLGWVVISNLLSLFAFYGGGIIEISKVRANQKATDSVTFRVIKGSQLLLRRRVI